MDINELWQNIQGEFSKQNKRLDGLETQVGTLTKEVGGLKKQFKNLNKKVNILTRDVKALDTRVGNLEETTQRIDKRLDNTININIARILNEQTAMRREMNEKFDRLILQEEQRRVYG